MRNGTAAGGRTSAGNAVLSTGHAFSFADLAKASVLLTTYTTPLYQHCDHMFPPLVQDPGSEKQRYNQFIGLFFVFWWCAAVEKFWNVAGTLSIFEVQVTTDKNWIIYETVSEDWSVWMENRYTTLVPWFIAAAIQSKPSLFGYEPHRILEAVQCFGKQCNCLPHPRGCWNGQLTIFNTAHIRTLKFYRYRIVKVRKRTTVKWHNSYITEYSMYNELRVQLLL